MKNTDENKRAIPVKCITGMAEAHKRPLAVQYFNEPV